MKDKSTTFSQKLNVLGGKTVTYKLDFIATTLEGRDVYDVRVDGNHYGYMTPELVEALESPDESGNTKINRLYLDHPSNENKMNQKIILDLPKHNEFNPHNITLRHIKYSDKLSKTITFRVAGDFSVKSNTFLEFDLNDNELEAELFFISNMDNSKDLPDRRSRYCLNFEDNLASTIVIEHMGQIQDINLTLNMKREGQISIQNSSVSLPKAVINADEYFSLAQSNIFVEKGSGFMQDGSGITINCDNFVLIKANVYFKENEALGTKNPKRNIASVTATNGLYLENINCTFMGNNNFKRVNTYDPTGILTSPIEATFFNVDARSDVEYSPFNKAIGGGENYVEKSFRMYSSTLENKDKTLNLSGDIYIRNSSIDNSGEGELNISSTNIKESVLKNVSSLFNTEFESAYVEDFKLFNRNYKDDYGKSKPFYFGLPDGPSTKYKRILKNSSVELGNDDCFSLSGKLAYIIESCNFRKNFRFFDNETLKKDEEDEIFFKDELKVVLNNSSFSNVNINYHHNGKNDLFSIKSSEISGDIETSSLEEISNSIIKQGIAKIKGLKKITDSYIENETINASYIKNGSLEGYNSSKIDDGGESLQKASKSTEDLEIL